MYWVVDVARKWV